MCFAACVVILRAVKENIQEDFRCFMVLYGTKMKKMKKYMIKFICA